MPEGDHCCGEQKWSRVQSSGLDQVISYSIKGWLHFFHLPPPWHTGGRKGPSFLPYDLSTFGPQPCHGPQPWHHMLPIHTHCPRRLRAVTNGQRELEDEAPIMAQNSWLCPSKDLLSRTAYWTSSPPVLLSLQEANSPYPKKDGVMLFPLF